VTPAEKERGRSGSGRSRVRRSGQEWPAELEEATAPALLCWALERWEERVALGTAFQAEGMVLLDMAWRIDPSVRVFTIDTGRLPAETHELIQRVRERYGIEVEVFFPEASRVEELVRLGGPNLFYRSPAERLACCRARKVEPLGRALAGLAAWVTGVRREQAATRASARRLERDPLRPGVVKINPLVDWSEEQVWGYLAAHEVPYHPLYERGYRSIGCAPCTRPSRPGEGPREGRWWWERESQPKECGLHWATAPAEEAPRAAALPVSRPASEQARPAPGVPASAAEAGEVRS
jgi:thioredoxin-dependent adenylylsulfate APS reductase